MCTSIAWNNGDLYIGRNMDISFDFDREIVIVPRNYTFTFKEMPEQNTHYAIMGTAMVVNNYPLFAEAVNEKGLYMAGLNFPEMAQFNKSDKTKNNITANEFIPYVLCNAKDIIEAGEILKQINITDTPFMPSLPVPGLHFIISDKVSSLVVECTKAGMHIYENKTGVMTNNPSFDMQMHNLNNYMHLTNKSPENKLTKEIELNNYCVGLGAIGLPGDFSSQSRFVKAYFLKANAVAQKTNAASVAQMFHMLGAVAMVRGSVLDAEKHDITVYSCCINADKGIYYFKTYESSCVSAVHMHNTNLDSCDMVVYPFSTNSFIWDIN